MLCNNMKLNDTYEGRNYNVIYLLTTIINKLGQYYAKQMLLKFEYRKQRSYQEKKME